MTMSGSLGRMMSRFSIEYQGYIWWEVDIYKGMVGYGRSDLINVVLFVFEHDSCNDKEYGDYECMD